jgi:pimeloyl-ACP methyl ester carboxylesterase
MIGGMESYAHAGMRFDVRDGGPPAGEAVVLLHGFPQTSAAWDEVAARLNTAGYRTLAPDQRGYSPGARPKGRRAYRQSELVGDVVGLLDAAGVERAHVVGHDHGGGVAWNLAMAHPERVRTITSLSTPHPAAFTRALHRSRQLQQSWYKLLFQLPWLPEAAGPHRNRSRFEQGLVRQGVPPDKARAYTELLAQPGAFTAALNWYRALPFQDRTLLRGRVTTPTLYVYSTGDRFLSRAAAERTAAHVDGPYRFEVIDADHWLPDNVAERVAELLLGHFGET